MLVGQNARRAKARARLAPAPTSNAPAARVAAIVAQAREKLLPFAAQEVNFDKAFAPGLNTSEYVGLGFSDGIGCLLKMASFELDPDGQLTQADLQRFEHEGAILINDIQSSALNYSVLLALFLTIYISLLVQHTGSGRYTTDPPASRLGHHNETFLWQDAAAVLAPQSAEAVRRWLYVGEVVTLCIGTLLCFAGLLPSVILYISLSTGLPSVTSKCELLLLRIKRMSFLMFTWSPCYLFLSISLPFVVARSSFLGFVGCAIICPIVIFSGFYSGNSPHGDNFNLTRMQHREARIILHKELAALGDGVGIPIPIASAVTSLGPGEV